ncbi:hypothetical protein ACTXT7_015589 [Hymenolepis weldensis]
MFHAMDRTVDFLLQTRSVGSNLTEPTNLESSIMQQLDGEANNPQQNTRQIMANKRILMKLNLNWYRLKQIGTITRRLLSEGN